MQTASTTIDAINSQQIDPLLLHFPLERTSNLIARFSYPTARHIVFRYRCSCRCRPGINRSVSSFTLDRPDLVLHWWPNSVHSSLSYFTPYFLLYSILWSCSRACQLGSVLLSTSQHRLCRHSTSATRDTGEGLALSVCFQDWVTRCSCIMHEPFGIHTLLEDVPVSLPLRDMCSCGVASRAQSSLDG